MFRSESSISSEWQFTGVSKASASWTAATPHRTLPVISDFDLPAATILSNRRSMLGRRAFSVAGPMAWNALPDDLRDPSLSADNFRKKLKTHLFRNALGHLAQCTWTLSALEALRNALYKFKTYLLTAPAFDAPVTGFPSEYCYAVWHGKTRMAWLPDGEKI